MGPRMNMLNDLKKKLDLQNIMGGVKSFISPEADTPDVSSGDKVGVKLAQVSTMVQELQAAQQEQVKTLKKINKMMNELFKAIEEERNPPAEEVKTTKTDEKKDTAGEKDANTEKDA